MPNSRELCNQEGQEHALVPPIVEVRDSLGSLAVQILAAREDLSKLDCPTMIHELYGICCDLHAAYDKERTRIV